MDKAPQVMKFRTTVILFLLSVLVAGLYFYLIKPAAEERAIMKDFEKRFFRADVSDIEFIRLDAGRGPVTIVQTEKGWQITKPRKMAPDNGVIEKLLDTIAKGRLIKIVGDKSDMDSFGFDRTWVVLALGYKGHIDVLRIGGENPSSTGNYAFAERLGKVFLVNKELAMGLNLKPFDLRDKRFFVFEPAKLGRISISKDDGSFTLERRGRRWKMVKPEEWDASDEEVDALVDMLHTQKAIEFIPWKEEFEALDRRMRIELSDIEENRIDSYEAIFWGTEWYKGILMHRPGSDEAGRTRREFWQILSRHFSQYMYRNLFALTDTGPERVTIKGMGMDFDASRQGGQWLSGSRVIRNERVAALIDVLSSWKASKLIDEDRVLGKVQLSVAITDKKGEQKVDVYDFNMDYEISGARMFVPVVPGRPETSKIDYWYARSSSLARGAVVSSLDMEKIEDALGRMNE